MISSQTRWPLDEWDGLFTIDLIQRMHEVWQKSYGTVFVFTKVFIFLNINISFKIVPLGSYTPMETCSHFWYQRWKSSTGMVFSMSVTLFWMFSKVPKWRPFEDIFKFRKKVAGSEVRWRGAWQPLKCLLRSNILWRSGQCDMGRCHEGASICLQCLVSREWPFSKPFKDIFIKYLVDSFFWRIKRTCWRPCTVEDFQHCYQTWEQRLHWYVAAQRNYFERG